MAGDQWRLLPYVFRDVLFDNLDQWVNSTHCGGCHRPLCAGFQALHFTSPGRGDVLRLAIGAVLHQTRGCARAHCLRHQSRKLCRRQHQPVPEPGFDIAPLARRLKSLFLHRRTPFQARNPSVFPHFETDILLKFKLMAAWPGNLAVATISAVELRHRWGAGRLLSGQN